ncbi:hypothetical protein KHC23_00925 [Ancylobacter dichloromethanicus]|uniref:Transmembrane protein n=1 Tax=Ancylobacter dichloromethanicus TaxID=518825 RepID=A0A9W6JBI1_9HYPH|nr:hypothetical protein [Ancylobacter dichloromethanicus]MBS7552222.1 hypothetical protein [Ancylobacter dichloromethanicus]GLK73957.1 hypothetical protein GCM10017643_40750 [Ancylobacter dichloromethanicus]
MLFRRETPNLWTLLTPPAVWALHFLFCYVAGAIICAKAPEALGELRLAIAAATGLALVIIAAAGAQAVRHWGFGSDAPPHNQPTDEDQKHFLAFATLLLAGLSAVAVLFGALPALFIAECGA